MVTLESVRVITLITISATDQIAAEATIRIGPIPTSMTPGRRMISVPMKPIAMAVQRRARTTSPSTNTASTVANSGALKPSAVTWASGVMLSP